MVTVYSLMSNSLLRLRSNRLYYINIVNYMFHNLDATLDAYYLYYAKFKRKYHEKVRITFPLRRRTWRTRTDVHATHFNP